MDKKWPEVQTRLCIQSEGNEDYKIKNPNLAPRIDAIIEFPYGIPCQFDALGMELPITIGSNKGIIAFPTIDDNFQTFFDPHPEEVMNRDLLPPKSANLKIPYAEDWGHFVDNSGNSDVRRCLFWFPCMWDNYREISLGISQMTKEYFNRFTLFMECFWENSIGENSCKGMEIEHPYQYWFINKKGRIIDAENAESHLTFIVRDQSSFISKSILEKSIDYANKNLKISDEHILLRDAYYNRNKEDYRRAILDATTAIEISFTKRIKKEYYKQEKNEDYVNSKFKRYPSLSGRIKLLKSLNIELPDSKDITIIDLGNLRNRAIHAGKIPNRTDTKKVIDYAIIILEKFSSICEK